MFSLLFIIKYYYFLAYYRRNILYTYLSQYFIRLSRSFNFFTFQEFFRHAIHIFKLGFILFPASFIFSVIGPLFFASYFFFALFPSTTFLKSALRHSGVDTPFQPSLAPPVIKIHICSSMRRSCLCSFCLLVVQMIQS